MTIVAARPNFELKSEGLTLAVIVEQVQDSFVNLLGFIVFQIVELFVTPIRILDSDGEADYTFTITAVQMRRAHPLQSSCLSVIIVLVGVRVEFHFISFPFVSLYLYYSMELGVCQSPIPQESTKSSGTM